jgi:hypothetical protein
MAVKFYNKYNQLITEIDGNKGRCEENTLSKDLVIYVEVECGEFDLEFEVLDSRINKWFPYQNKDNLENYKLHLTPGKFRIRLSTLFNEDKIALIFKGEENIDANFYIIPNFTQY